MNLHHAPADTGIWPPTSVVSGPCTRSATLCIGTLVEQPIGMSLINTLYMLLGAGVVAFGVLAHAAWTLITNNHRAKSERGNDTWEGDWEWLPATGSASSKPAVHRKSATADRKPGKLPADALDTAPDRPSTLRQQIPVIPRKPQRAVTPDPFAAMAKEVTRALVANGYDRATAQSAVDQVSKHDRRSLETWVVAALAACSSGARGIA